MKKWGWRLIAALAGLYLLAAAVLLPYLIEKILPPAVQEKTGGTLQLGSVSFNPFILELQVRDIRFTSPESKRLFALRRLEVNMDVLPLLWGELSLNNIGLISPKLYVEQHKDGSYNFDWLLRNLEAKSEKTATTDSDNTNAGLPAVAVETFSLEDGMVDFIDYSRPNTLHLTLQPVALSLHDLHTKGGGANRIHFSVGTGGGGLLDVKSHIVSFDPLALAGHVDYRAGKLYLAYHFLQQLSALELADGRMHAALDFDVNLSDMNATVIDDINLSVQKVRVISKATHADVLRVGQCSVTAGPILPLRQKAAVSEVAIDDMYLAAVRQPDKSIDWEHFFPSKEAAQSGAHEDNGSLKSKNGTWDAKIAKTQLRGLQVRFEDRSLPSPASLSVNDFNLTLSPVTTDLSRRVRFENRFGLNHRGAVEINGTIVPEPLRAEIDLRVDHLQLNPFDPYVRAVSYASLERGSISMDGRVAFAPSKRRADLRAMGRFRVDDLLVSDRRDAMPLVSTKALEIDSYLFEWKPNRLHVDGALLDAFYANILVDQNRTLNLASLMLPAEAESHDSQPTADAAKQKEPFPVRIVRFEVRNGAVHFADASLPLPFDTQVHDVNGQILNIATLPEETTYLHVDGEIDRYGTASAKGSFNAGSPKRFADIDVVFRNIELPSYTPYSGKFVGRAIRSGKLSVTLRYRIDQGTMRGDNTLVINKIEMGREIESNSSVSLPLEFAIALLEDSDGIIDIDMPVEGNVNNPDFKWGGVVWNAFVNLLTKAVTAPFELIGSMLGIEGDELKAVPFEAGSATIDAVARERLDLLAKALMKRPKLAITVTGTYNIEADKHALQRQALLKQLLGTKQIESIDAREELAPGLLEPIFVERMGEEALAALKAERDQLDTDDETKARTYTRKLVASLIKTQPLPDDALDSLALARAKAIRSYLAVHHGVAPQRVMGTDPVSSEAEDGIVASKITLVVSEQ